MVSFSRVISLTNLLYEISNNSIHWPLQTLEIRLRKQQHSHSYVSGLALSSLQKLNLQWLTLCFPVFSVMYPAYAKWVQSHRDLPIRLNQWCNVVVGTPSFSLSFFFFFFSKTHFVFPHLYIQRIGSLEAFLKYFGSQSAFLMTTYFVNRTENLTLMTVCPFASSSVGSSSTLSLSSVPASSCGRKGTVHLPHLRRQQKR